MLGLRNCRRHNATRRSRFIAQSWISFLPRLCGSSRPENEREGRVQGAFRASKPFLSAFFRSFFLSTFVNIVNMDLLLRKSRVVKCALRAPRLCQDTLGVLRRKRMLWRSPTGKSSFMDKFRSPSVEIVFRFRRCLATSNAKAHMCVRDRH